VTRVFFSFRFEKGEEKKMEIQKTRFFINLKRERPALLFPFLFIAFSTIL